MKIPNIFKRLTAIIMVVVMSVTFIPLGTIGGIDLSFKAGATGAEEVKTGYCGAHGDNVSYTLYDNGLLVIYGQGEMEDYDSLNPPPYCSSIAIEQVSIGSNITRIGNYAFCDCDCLTSVTISDSVISIGEDSFNFCYDLEVVDFTGSEEQWNNISIESGNGFLTSATINYYFNCEHINTTLYDQIDATCTEDGYTAGEYCEDCQTWLSGHEVIKAHHIDNDGDGLCEICEQKALNIIDSGYCGTQGDNVTYTLYDNGLLVIGGQGEMKSSTFSERTDITSVVISEGVKSIEDDAFSGCTGLTSVTIPYSVTSIGDWAFLGCTSLTSITIPDSVISIGGSAFYNTEYYDDSSNWNDNVLYIGDYLIEAKNDISGKYDILSGAKLIADEAFANCSALTSITIPYSVTSIGDWAFEGCTGLTSITIPDSVISMGDRAFEYCSCLTSITIPDSVTSIGYYTFAYCTSLISITIPDSVTSIGVWAFRGCTGLTSVTIPDSVISIGDRAFEGCTGLTSITVDEKNQNYSSVDGVLFNKEKTEFIQYPAVKEGASYTVPSSVTSIGHSAFKSCTGLASVIIPDSVKSIGSYAFYDCTGLTCITIPDSVKSIGSYAFYDCTGLTSVTISDSVSSIGDYAFEGCTGLTSITISDRVKSIGYSAFYYCYNLEDVYYMGSEEQWNDIFIDEENYCLTNATIHYNYKPVHTHSYTSSITTQATCTQEGIITYTCSCGDSYTVSIPMLDHVFKDTVLIAPTVFAEGKAIRTCENCDYSEEIILDKLESNTITDNNTGVSIIFENEAYNNTDIELKVTLNSNTDLLEIEDTVFNRFASYDIATLHDGEKVQPAQSIWVCVPLPEGFDENNTVVYYVSSENTYEKINSFCEDGKVYFNAEHFSEYVIVDESSVIEPNNNCSCICHKTGFAGFIYKIVRLFWRLFKIKPVCQCGVNHY